jgi:trehalose-phosphatase
MKTLRSYISLDRFFRDLAEADRRALILDYDGTLAPFRVRRDEAVPWAGVREAIRAILASSGSHVVVVSGRTVQEVVTLLGVDPPPEIWGAHGWQQMLPDGTCRTATPDERARKALADARDGLRRDGRIDMSEEKPGCVAIHWRGRDEREIDEIRSRYRAPWSELASLGGLTLVEFDGGLELRARGRDKGFVVRTIRSEIGEDVIMAVLGDDATDEDAFRALGEQDLAVLVRPEPRPTAADLWIEPPGELIAFLERWNEATSLPDPDRPRPCGTEPESGTKGERR